MEWTLKKYEIINGTTRLNNKLEMVQLEIWKIKRSLCYLQ